MKRLQDIKKEFRNSLVDSVTRSYDRLSQAIEENRYPNVSPDTKKALTQETGKYGWYHSIKNGLKLYYAKKEDSKKVLKEVDLLGGEEPIYEEVEQELSESEKTIKIWKSAFDKIKSKNGQFTESEIDHLLPYSAYHFLFSKNQNAFNELYNQLHLKTEIREEFKEWLKSSQFSEGMGFVDIERYFSHLLERKKGEIIKKIIDKDILTEYPLSLTVKAINYSIENVSESNTRAELMKREDFNKIKEYVEKIIREREKFPHFKLNHKAIETYTTLFSYAETEEEKQELVREMLKLRDYLIQHINFNVEEKDAQSFTSKFVNSDYSLTEEESVWWNKNKSQGFVKNAIRDRELLAELKEKQKNIKKFQEKTGLEEQDYWDYMEKKPDFKFNAFEPLYEEYLKAEFDKAALTEETTGVKINDHKPLYAAARLKTMDTKENIFLINYTVQIIINRLVLQVEASEEKRLNEERIKQELSMIEQTNELMNLLETNNTAEYNIDKIALDLMGNVDLESLD